MNQWIKFIDKHPEESGDYWIYRNRDSNTSRIFMRDYSKKYGWGIITLNNFQFDPNPEWTHWMKVERPKPPKKDMV